MVCALHSVWRWQVSVGGVFFRGMSGHDNFVRWSRVEVDLGMAEFGALANGFTTIETSRVAQRLKIITNNNGTRQERQR